MTAAANALTVQFLAWVAAAPRSYQDTMEAWRTSCPRLSIWEDAVRDGLVRIESGGRGMKHAAVALTPRGAAHLSANAALADAPPAAVRARTPLPVH